MEQVGRLWNIWDDAADIWVNGNVAYMAVEFSGLQIMDITNPDNITIRGYWDECAGHATGIFYRNDYVYVSDDLYGLYILDVSNPDFPSLAGSIDMPGTPCAVTVDGDRAYVACGVEGVFIIDIMDPTSPVNLGMYNTAGYTADLKVRNNIAYLADGAEGLVLLDVSIPNNVSIIGTFDTQYFAMGVYENDNVVFVADSSGGLYAIDTFLPNLPQELDWLAMPGAALGLKHDGGDFLYVAADSAGLVVVNVQDPSNLQLNGQVLTEGHSRRLGIQGDKAYIADNEAGLWIVNISNPWNPWQINRFRTPGAAYGVTAEGWYVYVAFGSLGLRIIDMFDPENPVEVGFLDTPSSARAVAVKNGRAYVADYEAGLRVINVSDPSHPVAMGSTDTWRARDVYVTDDYAYVADWSEGVRVVDISDPTRPRKVAQIEWPGDDADFPPAKARGITGQGNFLYVAVQERGLKVVDITNPLAPVEVDSLVFESGWTRGVTSEGGLAYVACGEGGLRIVDISDPFNIVEIGNVQTGGLAYSALPFGKIIYMADGVTGLWAIDISNPAIPQILGHQDTPGDAFMVGISTDYCVVAGYTNIGVYRYLGTAGTVQHVIPWAKYSIMGIPVIAPNGNPEVLFRNDLDNQAPRFPRWRVSRWDVYLQTYLRYREDNYPINVGGDPPPFAPGIGNWMVQAVVPHAIMVIDNEQFTDQLPQDQRHAVNLQKASFVPPQRGQNMVANPFNYLYDWRTTSVHNYTMDETTDITDAATRGWVSGYGYRWDPYRSEWSQVNYNLPQKYKLGLWEGCVFEQLTTDSLAILFTPRGFAGRMIPPPERDLPVAELKLSVIGTTGEFMDSDNIAGIRSNAKDSYDRYDAFEMDPISSPFIQLYFTHDTLEGVLAKRLAYDYREERDSEEIVWNFTIRAYNVPNSEVVLRWRNIAQIDAGYSYILHSADTGEEIANLRASEEYTFVTSADALDQRKYTLTAFYDPNRTGSNLAPPNEFGLNAVYPNPFNDNLRLTYRLPDARMLTIALYDTQGRVVSHIFNGEQTAGLHHTVYSGRSLASGIYFLRFSADELSVMHKVLLLK